MKKTAVAILASSLFSTAAVAAQYEVSITNLTHGQTFTPILVFFRMSQKFMPGSANTC